MRSTMAAASTPRGPESGPANRRQTIENIDVIEPFPVQCDLCWFAGMPSGPIVMLCCLWRLCGRHFIQHAEEHHRDRLLGG